MKGIKKKRVSNFLSHWSGGNPNSSAESIENESPGALHCSTVLEGALKKLRRTGAHRSQCLRPFRNLGFLHSFLIKHLAETFVESLIKKKDWRKFCELICDKCLIKQIANILGATNGYGRGPEAAAALQHEADLVHLQPKHGEDFVGAEARARCDIPKKHNHGPVFR